MKYGKQTSSAPVHRTRFAPSPTGRLHLGHAYSAIFAWNAAQATGGVFLLRIEDIDSTRCRTEWIEGIYEDLAWLGLSWPTPPRVQSEHLSAYREALRELETLDLLYPCFCTRKEIRENPSPMPPGPDGPLYPGTCRHLSERERAERIEAKTPYSLRLAMDRALERVGPLSWEEMEEGVREANAEAFGDVVLARKDIGTSYHLSVTVDDALQGITAVTRGNDLEPSTSIHRLLQELLHLPEPLYQHHQLLVDTNGIRLAKSHGSTSLSDLRAGGATPQDIYEACGLRPIRSSGDPTSG